MNGLDLFEEIRFIIELVLAEQLFAWSFAKRKRGFAKKTILGYSFLVTLAMLYVDFRIWTEQFDSFHITGAVTITWYIFLVILTLIHIKTCYEITMSDTLFMGISGFALQHIEYVAINEVLARGVWKDLPNRLFLYVMICVASCIGLYYIAARIFATKLKACGGIIYEDKSTTISYFLLMFIVLICSTFMCQNIYLNGRIDYLQVQYQGAVTDFCICTLVLVIQYSIFQINTLNREKEIIKQLLYERQKQYKLSKENIEIINRKCHDLKHQIQALKQADSKELDKYIDEVNNSIMIYDTVVKTENEVLNTILSEKCLYCENHKIKLTYMVDANQLDFMSTIDIYALLGNALDNAIECVRKYEDKEKRVISLTISAKGSFLCIQTNNYYEGILKIENGLPVTIKKNRAYHGFGMKSMKHLAEKYGGALYTNLDHEIFMLQIVIPIPAEFIRLLKQSEPK